MCPIVRPFFLLDQLVSLAEFGLRRAIVRTGMMATVLFVAETVPTFGPLLDLIGMIDWFLASPPPFRFPIIQFVHSGGSVLMMTSLVRLYCLFKSFWKTN